MKIFFAPILLSFVCLTAMADSDKQKAGKNWRPKAQDALYTLGAVYEAAKLCGSDSMALAKFLDQGRPEMETIKEYSDIRQVELDQYLADGKKAGRLIHGENKQAGSLDRMCSSAKDLISGRSYYRGANGRDSFMSDFGGRHAYSPPLREKAAAMTDDTSLSSSPSHYKCKEKNGTFSFSDRPCQ